MANGKMDEKQGGCFAWLIRVKKSVNLRWAKARDSLRQKLDRKRRGDKPKRDDAVINEHGLPDLIITKVPIKPRPSSPHKKPKGDTRITVTAPSTRPEGKTEVNEAVDKPPDKRLFIKCDPNGDPDEVEVRDFVLLIIKGAILELQANKVDADNDKIETVTDGDNLSMTSSVLSDLASAAVNDSLTNVIDEIKNRKMAETDSSLSSGAISDLATAAVNDSLTNVIDEIKNQKVAENDSSLSSGAISVLAEAAVTESLTRIVNEPDEENYSARKSTLTPRTVTEVLESLDIDPSIGLSVHAELEFPPCSP